MASTVGLRVLHDYYGLSDKWSPYISLFLFGLMIEVPYQFGIFPYATLFSDLLFMGLLVLFLSQY